MAKIIPCNVNRPTDHEQAMVDYKKYTALGKKWKKQWSKADADAKAAKEKSKK